LSQKKIIELPLEKRNVILQRFGSAKTQGKKVLVKNIHKEIGHFNERRTLAEVKKRFFWHDRTKSLRMVVRQCQRCQLAKSSGNFSSSIEEMKSNHVCDLFYKVALDTSRPLPETKNGNRYALVAIDHYSKWCEARPIKDHDATITAKFLEKEIICRFSVPRFILTDYEGEWMAEFDLMCKKYGITHQFTTPQWLQCNGMVERMIKTLKNGLSVVSSTDLDNWDIQLPRILFGYKCGVQASTKFFPFMVLIERTPWLTYDNGLFAFTNVEKDVPRMRRRS